MRNKYHIQFMQEDKKSIDKQLKTAEFMLSFGLEWCEHCQKTHLKRLHVGKKVPIAMGDTFMLNHEYLDLLDDTSRQ